MHWNVQFLFRMWCCNQGTLSSQNFTREFPLKVKPSVSSNEDWIPFVLTFRPYLLAARNSALWSFNVLQSDQETSLIFLNIHRSFHSIQPITFCETRLSIFISQVSTRNSYSRKRCNNCPFLKSRAQRLIESWPPFSLHKTHAQEIFS